MESLVLGMIIAILLNLLGKLEAAPPLTSACLFPVCWLIESLLY